MNPDLVLTADQKVVHFRKHLKKVNKLETIAARNGISKNGGIFISNSSKELLASDYKKPKDIDKAFQIPIKKQRVLIR